MVQLDVKNTTVKTRRLIDKVIRFLFIKRHIDRKRAAQSIRFNSTIKQSFQIDGFYCYSQDFLNIKNLLEEVVKECNSILARNEVFEQNRSGKDYLRHLMRKNDFVPSSNIMSLALNKKLIGLVADFLDDFPVLADIALLYSPPSENALVNKATFTGSQLFHMDDDDNSLCKVWLLLKDVELKDGPTVLIKKQKSLELASKTKYRKGGRIKKDADLIGYTDDSDLVKIIGKSGDVVFLDTAGVFHYGSRVLSGSSGRFMLMISYSTSFAMVNGVAGQKTTLPNYPINEVNSELNRIQRLMLINGKKSK